LGKQLSDRAVTYANQIKSRGTMVFSIAVGTEKNRYLLQKFSSNPNYYLDVPTYDELAQKIDDLKDVLSTGCKTQKGEPGKPGKRGADGPPGEAGPQGEKGMDGPDGLFGMFGEKGFKGERGDGVKGVKGFTGLAGIKGDAGSVYSYNVSLDVRPFKGSFISRYRVSTSS